MSAPKFDYDLHYAKLDLRKRPDLYRIGKGEQGVLLVEPYKSEILPYWKFRTEADAIQSSRAILKLFRKYGAEADFVGMDMARKFLQMGFTRARRYANHRSGKKYDGAVPLAMKGRSGAHRRSELPKDRDAEKAKSAEIFFAAWKLAERNRIYQRLRVKFLARSTVKKLSKTRK